MLPEVAVELKVCVGGGGGGVMIISNSSGVRHVLIRLRMDRRWRGLSISFFFCLISRKEGMYITMTKEASGQQPGENELHPGGGGDAYPTSGNMR